MLLLSYLMQPLCITLSNLTDLVAYLGPHIFLIGSIYLGKHPEHFSSFAKSNIPHGLFKKIYKIVFLTWFCSWFFW